MIRRLAMDVIALLMQLQSRSCAYKCRRGQYAQAIARFFAAENTQARSRFGN